MSGPKLLQPLLTSHLRQFCVAVVVLLTATVAAAIADDDIAEDAPPPVARRVFPIRGVYVNVFGPGCSNADLARAQLDTVLRGKLASVDAICELTGDQKRKLELAGRGEIKRLLDRVEKIEASLQRIDQEPRQLDDLLAELRLINQHLKSKFLDEGSLFDKVLNQIMTTDQIGRRTTLREIERTGGRVFADFARPSGLLEISLTGTEFNDADLARLKPLTGLQGLNLASTRITDAGLRHLKDLANLQSLDLTSTKITDAGLANLKRMQALMRLDLFGTQVTSAGLEHLSNLTGLTDLNLSDTRVTDPGLAHIKVLKKLRSLNLHQTQITDAGLVSLMDLTRLEWLDISGTQVTDAGLGHLKKLSSLQWINLSSTQVTDAGLIDLKRALPAANIWKRVDRE